MLFGVFSFTSSMELNAHAKGCAQDKERVGRACAVVRNFAEASAPFGLSACRVRKRRGDGAACRGGPPSFRRLSSLPKSCASAPKWKPTIVQPSTTTGGGAEPPGQTGRPKTPRTNAGGRCPPTAPKPIEIACFARPGVPEGKVEWEKMPCALRALADRLNLERNAIGPQTSMIMCGFALYQFFFYRAPGQTAQNGEQVFGARKFGLA